MLSGLASPFQSGKSAIFGSTHRPARWRTSCSPECGFWPSLRRTCFQGKRLASRVCESARVALLHSASCPTDSTLLPIPPGSTTTPFHRSRWPCNVQYLKRTYSCWFLDYPALVLRCYYSVRSQQLETALR